MAVDPSVLNKMNPKPPPTLSKETIGVWQGWCNMGNKEVARESAAKGTHVQLAITFLSYRNNTVYNEAELWYKNEVIKWIHELLDRRQIFKASHVLSNIKLDPASEFSKIFYATTNKDLREYIGKHLTKTGKLSEKCSKLWNFFTLIIENIALISKYGVTIDSLESLDQQSLQWKSEVATVLFLKSENIDLAPFITGETLWKHLLANNDIKNIKNWINIKYNSKFDDTMDCNVMEQFKRFPITSEMLETEIPKDIENLVLDEFSRFGIFRDIEKRNFLVILKRLNNTSSISNIYDILRKNTSLITIDQFIELLIDFSIERGLMHVMNVCIQNFRVIPKKSSHLQLICDYRLLVRNFNEVSFRNNIFNTSLILGKDQILNYFAENPLILLALLFFTKDVNILELVNKNSSLMMNEIDLLPCLPGVIASFPILMTICRQKIEGPPVCDLTFYDLMEKHLEIDTKALFKFRFDQNKPNKLPHFNNKELIEKFGYSKKNNYKFYLKQARPSTAAKVFLVDYLNLNKNLEDDEMTRTEQKVFRIGVANFDSDEITSSCVAFLEMIGRDSHNLRVMISVAKVLAEAHYKKESILEMLSNSDDEPYVLQNLLETSLFQTVEQNLFVTGSDLVKALKTFEIVIQYSKINNLKLPESLLKHCALNNLWLPFLILAQIYNYPLDQIKLLIQFFRSPTMSEHLTHGVIHDIHVEESNVLIRDSRTHFLSKVGVRKSLEFLNYNLSHSIRSQSSLGSGESSSGSELFEIDIYNFKATVLQTLIRCHNSTDPPKALLQACQLYRNPLLAIFATSYEPDSIITNWLTWLAVSCELCHTFTNYETFAINSNSVSNLLENCMKNKFPKTLLESFEIFLPDNPLRIFLEFLMSCVMQRLDSQILLAKLDQFQASLRNCRKNSILSETDHEMTYLNNRMWIELTSRRLLASVLNDNCTSVYQQIIIVEALHNLKIWNYFTIDFPNLFDLLNMLKVLFDGKTGIKLDIALIFDPKTKRQAIISCINSLLDTHFFNTALEIAYIENLPPDLILIKQWQTKMANTQRPQDFWQNCDQTLTKHNVTADCVIDFYTDCSEKLGDLFEKFTVLKFAWNWSTKFELSCRYELEKKMWLAYLYLDEKHKNLNQFCFKRTQRLFKDLTEMLDEIVAYEGELSKEFTRQVEKIMAFALTKGDCWQALRLQRMFNCNCNDLESLKLCFNLAEGILLPYQLNSHQRLLLSNLTYLRTYTHRRTLLSTRVSSFSSSSHSPASSLLQNVQDIPMNESSTSNDTLAILKLLAEHLHHGFEIGQIIFMTYRISINIEIPYQVIVASSDGMKMLKDALEDDCMNKLDVVHDFIQVYKWDKNEVADFICEELINAMKRHEQSGTDQLILWDINVDHDFQVILQLLYENCSILGHKIYTYACILYESYNESATQANDLVLIVEFLIRAHDCFTADCNMEGISIILKTSKEIISTLLVLKEWKLIVRLLTGVARYTEMNYVFQILMENDHFEFLLRKNLKWDSSLKIALLDFLKKFCPDNKDLYKIVALHFTLFSEVAILWEAEAQSVIKNLISISTLEMQNCKLNPEEEPFLLFQNNEGTKVCLNKAMENYSHATDFHLQGDKLNKAMYSAKQAELIGLQLGLLSQVSQKSSVECLLNLTSSQIVTLISSKLTFEQSLILVEAYNFHADWASILFEQYVLNNNSPYFHSFLQHIPLTDTLVHDISRKFVSLKINTHQQIKNMNTILEHLPSIHVKYRIASELGFSDFVADLISGDQLVYLKDTVWKKGYKN